MWTTNADAIIDLRRLLSDGDTDKFCDLKLVFGKINGTNLRFKTFEQRRITNLSTVIVAPSPVGVFKNDVILDPTTDVTQDDPISGTFLLSTAPVDGDELRASYYYQWFLDAELDQFLQNASQWLGTGSTYVNTEDGLIPAALHYAAQEAYTKLALWASMSQSNVYMLNDVPNADSKGAVKTFQSMAEMMQKKSNELRQGFYGRNDQALAPLFRSSFGRVTTLTPRR